MILPTEEELKVGGPALDWELRTINARRARQRSEFNKARTMGRPVPELAPEDNLIYCRAARFWADSWADAKAQYEEGSYDHPRP